MVRRIDGQAPPDALSRASLRTQATATSPALDGPLRRVQQDVLHLRRVEPCRRLHVHAHRGATRQGDHRRSGGPGHADGGARRPLETANDGPTVVRAPAAWTQRTVLAWRATGP